MKRPSYRAAVEFIALNDEPLDHDPDSIENYTTVVMVAALFDVETSRVADDVARIRVQGDTA